jgi:ABC-type glutathione transport system ATPase component
MMNSGLGAKQALAPALLQVKGLGKRFVQRAPFSSKKFVIEALNSVDMEIQPYCVTAVVGESGSGKSTLAACIAFLQNFDTGQIWFEGKELSNCTFHEVGVLRPKIQLVFQDSAGALNPRFTAAQIIKEPLEIQKLVPTEHLRQRACELMEQVGLSADWANRLPSHLSGGQRQRLTIARALALKPKLLILDESLSGLDLITQAQILDLLLKLRATHALTYLLISHDISLVSQVADYIAVMHKGSVVERGRREQLLVAPQHEHTRALINSARAYESKFHEVRSGLQV